MRVLGISAYYHDSAAALVEEGSIVAAAQQERFSRRKHDAGFPAEAIRYCLAEAGVPLAGIDRIVFYDKPLLKFERLLETSLAFAPRGFRSFRAAAPVWLREKLFQKDLLARELRAIGGPDADWSRRLLFAEHHFSHAASAFFPSPFRDAAILTMDGVGEWATTSRALGDDNVLRIDREIHFPHSLGLLYSAFTSYAGFRVNSGEYKLMGLAAYGEPRYAGLIRDRVIDIKPDGSFRLNLEYFDYCTGLRMINRRFERLFGGPARKPGEPLTPRHMDAAASIQAVLEEVVLGMVRALARDTGRRNLCLAGGVALNAVANGKIARDGSFANVWIQPAAGDAGGALGAALAGYYLHEGCARPSTPGDAMRGAYLGPSFAQEEIERRLRRAGARFEVLDHAALIDACVDALAAEKAVGWLQGRMEFGPRALGARSILADPRSPRMQSTLNLKVKRRESFRPFAPSVLAERAGEWFELEGESPYMLLVADVAASRRRTLSPEELALTGLDRLAVPRSEIPAVTHVDCSARVQTVRRDSNPLFYELLEAFERRTGCPLLVNTSFNLHGEPIVCTPEDAFACFRSTELDALAAGRCWLTKPQPA